MQAARRAVEAGVAEAEDPPVRTHLPVAGVPGVSAMPTIGALRCWPPMEPKNGSQNENTPPSDATRR